MGFLLVAGSRGYSLVHRLLTVVAPLVVEHGLQGSQASVVAARRLSSYYSKVLEQQAQ